MKKSVSPIAATWEEIQKEMFTPQEIAECDLWVSVVGELIRARQEMGISTKDLAELSGVKQSKITQLECGRNSPTIHTVMQLLMPLGKKLAVVDIDDSM